MLSLHICVIFRDAKHVVHLHDMLLLYRLSWLAVP